ncbi:ABC transporter permease [Aeromicrobium piscarium]|uniref:FtsX-like permease family protein n=1 Tax=Aeromicrobium piscarium TaxID=2590901 RepID=A0A554RI44_9ACTN|nr:FtsX-like permease family protein [Aeromicrobium piscarium]TSD53700.1 FtsX-like permease family protein [Aeromicrobium piscarium]
MLKVTLRNLLARKVRLVLSAFAIVLGIAFVAGSLVFTDTMGKSFDNIVYGTVSDVNVRFEDSGQAGLENEVNLDDRSMPASLVQTIADVDGVARADGNVEGMGLFVKKKDGTLLGGTGAPTLAFNWNDAPNADGDQIATISQGEIPEGPDEVAIDERSIENAGYELGDTVEMFTTGAEPQVEAKLVGIVEFAGGGLAGATLVTFDTPRAQELFLDGQDAYSSISVEADPGVSQTELADRVAQVLPDGAEAVTGDDLADETQSIINTVLGFLNTFLLVFAAIALVVGTFLIVNTFSILVAQRSRELALLRAMGASRGQVTRSVLTEAFAVGVLGSTLGLVLGYGLAAVLKALFGQFGLDLSGTALVFAPRTVIVSYVVGILVTMVAAWFPARRAAKVPPVAAMRDDVALPEGTIHKRLIVGVALAAAGAALMAAGLFGDVPKAPAWIGIGIFFVLMAVALTSPVTALPVIALTGVLNRALFGAVGRLATQNASRNPRRTAATASALMIGLALVTTMSVLGSSINRSIEAGVDEQFTTDFLVSNAIGQPFSTTVAEDVAALPGVGEVSAEQNVGFGVDDRSVYGSAVDPASLDRIFELSYSSGHAPEATDQIAFNETTADQLGVSTGDRLDLTFPGTELPVTVSGVYADTYVVGPSLVLRDVIEQVGLKRVDSYLAVNAAPGADLDEVGDEITDAVAAIPTVTVQDKQEFADAQRAQVNQLLYLIYALLGLAIVIAVLGIINTLSLSVIERTREVGLLRAVGLSRRQLRRMVRLESITIAVLGALLGIASGLLFGVSLRSAFSHEGITHLAIPWVQLAVFVVVAAVVGVLAAVVPAWRASRLNVLRAIATD